MLSSITPLGERGRGNRYWLTVTAFSIGATLGGALTGAAFATAGLGLSALGLSATAIALAAVAVASLALFYDAVPRVSLPHWKRQVNEDWLTMYRGWVYGAGFGFQLGLGLATIVTAATVYLVFAIALLSAAPAIGAAIGATFGAVRGVSILAAAGVGSFDELRDLHRRINARARMARSATVVADGAVLVAGLAALAVALA